jgi:hypothetical protein
MNLVGARSEPAVTGVEELAGRSHYFVGNDPERWRRDVPHYGRVAYRDVWKGVDLAFYGTEHGQLETDFTVLPGSDPRVIRLAFEGARRIRLNATGDLVLELDAGSVVQRRPFVYQEMGGTRTAVSASWELHGKQQVGFRLGTYDRSRPLVIDPVLEYSTYLGGTGDETGWGIAVDAAGNAYVTGETASTDFPTAGPPAQPAHAGGLLDAFVTKLSSTSEVIYSTYLGGGLDDQAFGIAVDAGGNAYVTGSTSSADFPTAGTPSQANKAGAADAFVVKLDPAGAPLYSTFLGGAGWDWGMAVAVDTAGNAYVMGDTSSNDFPTAGTPSQPTPGGFGDVFVTKLGSTSALVYSTYLGGLGFEWGRGIALDAAGNAYVTGGTEAANFPTAGSPLQAAKKGRGDAFITQLSPTSSLVYSTYLGGNDTDVEGADGIALDPAGSVYVTGLTDANDFPTAGPPAQGARAGGWDAFVAKVSPTAGLVYSTYLGGSGNERAWGVAVDAGGNANVTGQTASANFPTTGGPLQPACGGAFVTRMGPTSTRLYSTCISDGVGRDIAVDPKGDAYVTGSAGPAFPVAGTPSQPNHAGGSDAFVAKFRWATDFYTVSPCRVVDTRDASGGPALSANTTRSFPVAGTCGVPATAAAVAINVTVAGPTGPGHLKLFPAGGAVPDASTINFVAGSVRANNAIISLGGGGQIAVRCNMPASPAGQTHFVLDVTGYFR